MKTLVNDKGAEIVAEHHKRAVDAATNLMEKATESIAHRDHFHAVELLKCAIKHLKTAEIIQGILKDLPRGTSKR